MQTTIIAETQPKPVLDGAQPGCTGSLSEAPDSSQVSGSIPPPPPSPSTPAFPRCPGETPRAFSAFLAFFQLGHGRSLLALADHLGEKHDTVKAWSSKYHWTDRIHSFNSGLLAQQAEAEAAARRQQAADWSRRTNAYREQEWAASQKLLAAAQCYLESFGDQAVEKMTLSQVSRALEISSKMARLALSGTHVPDEPALAPLQEELVAALQKAYGPPSPPQPAANNHRQPGRNEPGSAAIN